MKTIRKYQKLGITGMLIAFFFLLNTSFTPTLTEIEIDVAPAVLNLQNQAQVVTVHTSIAYGLVVASTVYLNDIAIDSWKADDRGFFVAKFLMNDVKNLPFNIGADNRLMLVGKTITGENFWGEETIKVINVIPKK